MSKIKYTVTNSIIQRITKNLNPDIINRGGCGYFSILYNMIYPDSRIVRCTHLHNGSNNSHVMVLHQGIMLDSNGGLPLESLLKTFGVKKIYDKKDLFKQNLVKDEWVLYFESQEDICNSYLSGTFNNEFKDFQVMLNNVLQNE